MSSERYCPVCNAPYDVIDAVCPVCGAELPAPYEGSAGGAVRSSTFDDATSVATENETMVGLEGRQVSLGRARVAVAPEELTILAGAEVVLEETSLTPGTLVLAGERIIEIHDGTLPDPRNGARYYDLSGQTLAAGFIDVHIHGMMGIDSNGASQDDLQRISREAAKHGITSLLPTMVACSAVELGQFLETLRQAGEAGFAGTRLLGLHLESNFISMDFKGAQPPDQIFAPNDPRAGAIIEMLDTFQDVIRIVTLAPEQPGALDLIGWLRERQIMVSLGHSAATYDEAIAGFDAGATHATHLFNAMSPLHHRNPGLVGAALERDDVYTEVVCDGVHVHPAVISTVISAKGPERVMPISDALQGAGLADGAEFLLGGQHVKVQNGVARLDSGTIAGSITTMDRIVRFLVDKVGWNVGEALAMAAATPADALGIEDLGRIVPGAVADLVVLDPDMQVVMTLVGGTVVYQR